MIWLKKNAISLLAELKEDYKLYESQRGVNDMNGFEGEGKVQIASYNMSLVHKIEIP